MSGGALALAKPKVEIAFVTDPLATTPTWEDVTNDVRSFTTNRGRQHELSRVEAGTATVVLNDREDRRFDPTNTAGAYYPNVLPMRKLRISAGWNLLSADQASAEIGVSGYTTAAGTVGTGDNCTLANPVLGSALDGTHVLELTSVALGAMSTGTPPGTAGFPVFAGSTYSVMASFRSAAATRTVFVGIHWYTAAGASISAPSTSHSASSAAWTTLTGNLVAPATAAYARLFFQVNATGGAGEVWYVDEAALFPSADITTWSKGVQYLFTGYIESWAPTWPDMTNTDVTVEAVDAFKVLNLRKIAGTLYRDAVLASSPTGYWPLYETAPGTTTAVDLGSGAHNGTYTDAVTFGANGANPADVDTAVDLGNAAGWVSIPSAASFSGTGNFTIEFWVDMRSQTLNTAWFLQYDSVGGELVEVSNVGSTVLFTVVDNSGNGGFLQTTGTFPFGSWVHIACVKSGTTGPAGGWKVYINGVDALSGGSTVTVGTGNANLAQKAIGIGASIVASAYAPGLDGLMQHVAFYGSALAGATILAHYNTTSGFTAPAVTGDRIDAVLDAIDFPSADRIIDTGQFSMQAVTAPLNTTPSLGYVQSLVDSEGGPAVVFMDTLGRIVFQDRAHPIPSSSGTFGDAPGEMAYLLNGTAPVFDDLDIWNEIAYQAVNGQTQIAIDATSQAAYAIRTLSKTGLQNASDADVATLAAVDRSRYKDPAVRIKSITVHPPGQPADLWSQALGRELNDRITVHRLVFGGGGSLFSMDARIEGITHEYRSDPGDWLTTWRLAPTNAALLLTLDDTSFGILDTDVLA